MFFKKILLSIALVILLLLQNGVAAHAQIVPGDCVGNQYGNECGLDDLLGVFEGAYGTAIAYLGGITLLFFVIGGFVLLISGGRSNMVDMGKKILVGAVFGALIVLGSFLAVDVIQTRVFQLDQTQQIGSDTQCESSTDGDPCRRNGQNVYTCISGVCTTVSQCSWINRNGPYLTYTVQSQDYRVSKNCYNRNACNTSQTIDTDLCPGDSDMVCCYISETSL